MQEKKTVHMSLALGDTGRLSVRDGDGTTVFSVPPGQAAVPLSVSMDGAESRHVVYRDQLAICAAFEHVVTLAKQENVRVLDLVIDDLDTSDPVGTVSIQLGDLKINVVPRADPAE